jgi:hypothetical protein
LRERAADETRKNDWENEPAAAPQRDHRRFLLQNHGSDVRRYQS